MLMFFSGKDITAYRKSRGLTLKQFAEMIGVSEAAVSRWESDKRQPRRDAAQKLRDLVEQTNGHAAAK